jgi:hypothetical protein
VSDQVAGVAPDVVASGGQESLGAGASGLLRPRARASLRNAGTAPLTVIVVTLVSVAEDRP